MLLSKLRNRKFNPTGICDEGAGFVAVSLCECAGSSESPGTRCLLAYMYVQHRSCILLSVDYTFHHMTTGLGSAVAQW